MQPKTMFLAGLASLTFAACDVSAPTAADCGARTYQTLVGQPIGANLWPDMMEVRVVDPDTMVTMDFVPTRMNVWVGRDGRIERIDCG